MRETSSLLRAAFLGCSLAVLPPAFGQSYPAKSIQMIVPYPAGGTTDSIARLVSEKLTARLGQSVVVENRPGASGIIGTSAVAKARPDGYTLVMSITTSLLTNQFLYKKLPYNPQRDLALVSLVATGPMVLLVNSSVPVDNASSLATYLTAHKGKVAYGTWGVGSGAHLPLAHLSSKLDADMSHITYKGEPPILQDLVSGQIQLTFASTIQAKSFLETGRVKALGVTGERRVPGLPNVPTLVEQGWTDDIFRIAGWVGLAAPAGTPKEVVVMLANEIAAICQMPDVKARVVGLIGAEPLGLGPAAFNAIYQKELPVWQRLVRETGATLD